MTAEQAQAADGQPPFRHVDFPIADVSVETRDDGTILYSCHLDPDPYEPNLYRLLEKAAAERPGQPYLKIREKLADGSTGDWLELTYGALDRNARALGQYFLDQGWGQDSGPILVLSENSFAHVSIMFGGYVAQVPVASVSPGYSLMSTSFDKLKHVFDLVKPCAIFVEDGPRFEPALKALDLGACQVIACTPPNDVPAQSFQALLDTQPTEAVQNSIDAITGETIGKILFTSGSTGMPKGVLQSHQLMASNCSMTTSVRRLGDVGADYQVIDWLPWSHSFGGNSNLNACLRMGGTLYIDQGKPLPGQFEETLRTLRDFAPSFYSSTPAAFALLVNALEDEPVLRKTFFSRLKAMSYGGASLPEDLFRRMQDVAVQETGKRIVLMSGYGATETGPSVTLSYFASDLVGLLGLPLPGTTVKMVPHGDTYELRFKAPCITPGYVNQPDLTDAAFDEEGFYKIGDAGSFVDPARPELGLKFDGRVAEEFKLLTGTFVSVGKLRLDAVAACSPLVRDAVITGHDRDFIGVMAWPHEAQVRALAGVADDAPLEDAFASAKVRAKIAEGLAAHNAVNKGSSTRIKRFIWLAEPPNADGHEITDKGYINQRATLQRRADFVERLYADTPDADVIEV